jgi:hypothetical protein
VPRRRILDQNVYLGDDFLEQLLPLFLLEIEGDGEFVPCLGEEPDAALFTVCGLEHVLFPAKRGQLPQRVASRRLDHDDLGSQFREVGGAPVADDHVGRAVQYADAIQGFRFVRVELLPDRGFDP